MEIFVESPWVWIAITIFMLLVSYAFYVNDRNIKRLMIMLLTAAGRGAFLHSEASRGKP